MHTQRMPDPYTTTLVLSQGDVGPEGWRILQEDARRMGRKASAQTLAYVRRAIWERLNGKNVELTPAQLDQLLDQQLEPVA